MELVEEERRIDATEIVTRAPGPAIAADQRNRILCWNRAAAELIGFAGDDRVRGKELYQVLDATDIFGNRLAGEPFALWEMVIRGEAVESFEIAIGTASGDRQRTRVSVVVILESESTAYRLVYLLRPILRRRKADEAIEHILASPAAAVRAASVGSNGARPRGPALSLREMEVLSLLDHGNAVDEIAKDLNLSVHTVRSHVRNILKKLGVHSQLEAIARARSEHLI